MLLRGTPDVDLLIKDNIDFETFNRDVFPTVAPYLKKMGFQVQPKKGRGNQSIKVMKRQNHPDAEQFLMHWTTFDSGVFAAFSDYIKRQIDFSKTVPYYNQQSGSVRVASLEEIVPLKLKRSTHYGSDREELVGPLYTSLIEHARKGNWGFLASMPLETMREGIKRMQDSLGSDGPYTRERVGSYKLSKDIYDLCLASRVISDNISSFDKDRYEENLHRILDRTADSSSEVSI